ncbi:MAG: sigma-70 family RNA polymerase sigma factor [Opitutus sp.]|nr:sigma-70 family RNA polymerase sigma factor [Opitutus sp.]
MAGSDPSVPGKPTPAFATTQWSLVLQAAGPGAPEAARALAGLCATYWYPLYAFVRRQGHSAHDAQDLTQEFFARLIEKNVLAQVAREKGRFRSFLLAALKNFLANEWDKARAQKRGGGRTFVPLDAGSAESRYAIEPVDTLSADRIYERRWALTLLDRVLDRLRAEHAAGGKAAAFEALKGCLTDGRSAASYAEIAAHLQTTEGAIKVAVHRLRHRYRELLREEVTETLGRAEEVDDELRHLIAALAER